MPSRKTTKAAEAAAAAMPSIPKELIDQFVTGPMSAQAVNAGSERAWRAPALLSPAVARWARGGGGWPGACVAEAPRAVPAATTI